MNWFKRTKTRLKLAQFQGEYWITDNGMVLGADGDIDNLNHEAQIIQTVQDQITDGKDYEEWKQEKIQEKMEEEGHQNEEDALMSVLREEGITNEEYQIAEGIHPDAREYGMKELGHKRLEGRNVETWSLTSSDMHDIAEGIFEVYGEDVEKATFNIYVFDQNKWFTDIPFTVIETGKPSALRGYDSHWT